MYTYEITPDFKANVYDPEGNLIDWPGPWQNAEEATEWATAFVNGLNDGSITWPPADYEDSE
jgi:hypothetical protein